MNEKSAHSPLVFTLQIIHASLMIGVTIFLGVTYFLYTNRAPEIQTELNTDYLLNYSYVAIAVAVFGFFTGDFLFKSIL